MIVEDNLLYKIVKTPKSVRKTILNTAINFIELMQQQIMIKEIREEKRKVMLMLMREMKTTNDLLHQFYSSIPKAKLEKHKKVIHKYPHPKHHKQKKQFKIEPSKLDHLDREILSIKSKLNSI